MDGSGHHRGLAGPLIAAPARVLAAADAYHAMRHGLVDPARVTRPGTP